MGYYWWDPGELAPRPAIEPRHGRPILLIGRMAFELDWCSPVWPTPRPQTASAQTSEGGGEADPEQSGARRGS